MVAAPVTYFGATGDTGERFLMGCQPTFCSLLALVFAAACAADDRDVRLAGDAGGRDSTVDYAQAPSSGTGGSGGSAPPDAAGDRPFDVGTTVDTRLLQPDAASDSPSPSPDAPGAPGRCEGGRLLWARGTRGAGRVHFAGTALSPDGTAWVTGNFQGTVTFWAGQPGETTRTAPDSARELFLLKISPDGALLKFITVAHGCGGSNQPGWTEGTGVAALADGSVLLMGNFARGEVTIGTTTFNARGSRAMFLARYRADGSPLWVAGSSGPGEPGPYGTGCSPEQAMRCDASCGSSSFGSRLVALPDGRARVVGFWGPGTVLHGTTATASTITNSAGHYIAAYAADGAHEWARPRVAETPWSWDVLGAEAPSDVTLSADGSSFLTGRVSLDVHYGAGLMTRVSADGTMLWTKGPGAPGNPVYINTVLAFADGSTLTGGALNGTIIFGAGEPRETALTVPHPSAYLASYEADGALAWARLLTTDFTSPGLSHLVPFPTGGFVLVGSGGGERRVNLSGWGACGGSITGIAGVDWLLFARFDASLSIMWSKIEGIAGPVGSGLDGLDVATGADGTMLIASHNRGAATLGRGEPNETTLPAHEMPYQYNGFVAKFGP
jgi:hypothetical protein